MNNYKSTCKTITHNSETKSPEMWAQLAGISRSTLMRRLAKGCTIEETLMPKPYWQERKLCRKIQPPCD